MTKKTDTISINKLETNTTVYPITSKVEELSENVSENISDIKLIKSNFEDFENDYIVDTKLMLQDIDTLYERYLKLELDLHKYKSLLICTVVAVFLTMILTVVVR